MWDEIQFILLLTAYIGVTFLMIRWMRKRLVNANKYVRLFSLSFVYALFWGIGIAGSGGEPGFALPAPNIAALGLMISIGFYQGLKTGLMILGFWWLIIFMGMLLRLLISRKKVNSSSSQPKEG